MSARARAIVLAGAWLAATAGSSHAADWRSDPAESRLEIVVTFDGTPGVWLLLVTLAGAKGDVVSIQYGPACTAAEQFPPWSQARRWK